MTIFEVNVRVVVDTTTKRSAETYRDDLMSSLPSWAEVVACEGTVSGATVIPLVTGRDLDARGRDLDSRYAQLLEMAKVLNRHSSLMEERIVLQRARLARTLSNDLHSLVDELDRGRHDA